MSSIIRKFNIFRDIPPNITQNIKSFYVSRDFNYFGYCVTNDNKVYGFGDDIHQLLGYHKSNDNKKYVIITELCDQNIQEFYQGYGFMFARDDKNQIFGWGENKRGQLGLGYQSESNESLRPQKCDFFDNKNIIHICSTDYHSFAVTSNAAIYGWGKIDQVIISQPILLKINNLVNIKSIINIYYRINLFILTFDGMVYEFCKCSDSEESSDEMCFEWKQFFDLNEFNKLIDKQIIDVCVKSNYAEKSTELIFQTENCVYVYKNSKIEGTYKTLFEYYFYGALTYKTIFIIKHEYFVNYLEKDEQNSQEIVIKLKQISSNDCSDTQTNEMKPNLRKLVISKDFLQNIDTNVRYVYQSYLFSIFVLNNNKVYSLGQDTFGKHGLGGEKHINEETLISELSDQNIEEFYEGINCIFARNDKNQIFSWGKNHFGQLGRGFKSDEDSFLIPQKIEFFDDKNIIHINSGVYHCLALSSDCELYGWGANKYGQIGIGNGEDVIIKPIKIDFAKIKFIHCSRHLSLAVSTDGSAYFWGEYEYSWETRNKTKSYQYVPKILPMKNVSIISYYCADEDYIVILDNNGKVLMYNIFKDKTIEIKCGVKFKDFYFGDFSLLQSEDCVYKSNGKLNIIETNFINFYDFYYQKPMKYRKTIHVTKDGYLMIKELVFNENERVLTVEDQSVFENKYETIFDEIEEMGSGSYGDVKRVKKKSNEVLYAIKRVELKNELDLKEIKIMCKFDMNFVVQYIDSWIEGKVIQNKIKKYLFIQMELCSHNMRDIIKSLKQISEQRFKTFNYFISCELFKELTECVNYLHSLKPPIIHRDLKPENILISEGIDGRVLKLCDFGLSQIHENLLHTRMVGTDTYMAPEVRDGETYDHKSDIYSLALIASEIFQFEASVRKIKRLSNLSKYSNHSNITFENQYNILLNVLEKCLYSDNYEDRPDSRQLLTKIYELVIDKSLVINDINISVFREVLNKPDNNILSFIFEYKLDNSAVKNFIKQIFGSHDTTHNIKYEQSKIYETLYDEICELGRGGFGTVFEVKNKLTNETFAIKKIKINHEMDLREMKIIAKLNNNKSIDFIVKYINIWVERQFLFIQMEMCPKNMRDIIVLNDQINDETFKTFNYFISCELFRELIECVNYLHSIPVIHRDLKPENILISDGFNGRFLKLCDFGLAKIHDISLHTRAQGTLSYMAPEVENSENYNTKSDIYSLALIATELFKFEDNVRKIRKQSDLNKYLTKYLNTNLETNFKHLLETLSICLYSKDFNSRPNCEELLRKINERSVDKNVVLMDENICEFQSILLREENLILKNIFDTKIIYHNFENSDSIDTILPKINKYIECSAICIGATNFLSKLNEEDMVTIDQVTIKQLIDASLKTMQTHPNDKHLQKNAMSALNSYYIFTNVTFDRLLCCQLVLESLVCFKDTAMNLVAVNILLNLVYKLSRDEKSNLATNHIYMETLLEIIRQRNGTVVSKDLDLLMLTMTALWNLSDDSQDICEIFLAKEGIDLYLKILKRYKGIRYFDRHILGFLGNVAQLSHLRTYFMNPELLFNLRDLMNSNTKEISYLAAGIFAHLCSDRNHLDYSVFDFSEVFNQLITVVLNWETLELPYVSYSSFLMLVPLLNCFETPGVQMWAIWTIHYLCSKNPKYCEMLLEVEGLNIIQRIIETPLCEQNKQSRIYCHQILDLFT